MSKRIRGRVHRESTPSLSVCATPSSTPRNSASSTPSTKRSKNVLVASSPEPRSARRGLDFSESENLDPDQTSKSFRWSEDEVKQLVTYIYLSGFKHKWPSFKVDHCFWSGMDSFISQESQSPPRSGSACRSKLNKDVRTRFDSPSEAFCWFYPHGLSAAETDSGDVNTTEQLQFISQLFAQYAISTHGILIPNDFLQLSLCAMKQLNTTGRSNVVYNLVKCIGTMRPGEESSRLPVDRMPMGLLEYCVNFFSSSNLQQIHCPEDYRQWLVSMFCIFGTKFVKLFNGPMWKVDETAQCGSMAVSSPGVHNTMKARVNIPGLSERQLERDIASSGFTIGSNIQLKMLETAQSASPDCNWWLKGDGCDLVEGLGESTRLIWSGDVDLNDGKREELYKTYRSLLDFIGSLTISDDAIVNLNKCSAILLQEKEFLVKALENAHKIYSEKLDVGKCQSNAVFAAGWTVEELNHLISDHQLITANINAFVGSLEDDKSDADLARTLSKIQEQLTAFVRSLYRHKRQPASNVYVFMISSELRQSKPYALPVQLLPYKSLDVKTMRGLVCEMVKAMRSKGMKVVGFSSNGEFNSMRNKGYVRPLSLFCIRSQVRAKYARLSERMMLAMLTPITVSGTQLAAEKHNPAVPPVLLCEIWLLKTVASLSWDDIISRLRQRTVPAGYSIHAWKSGQTIESEQRVDKLRSILSQLEFSHIVCDYDCNGVPFRSHLHVPEVHPLTGHTWYEREDPGHVLKRIATCTREGGPRGIKLERYVEALKEPKTGLTYPALVGMRKQSVQDAERMFSLPLCDFMTERGYIKEAEYISAVNGWRRACDERGISSLKRCRLNYQLLNYILDELMPWHKENYDFSTMEVNSDINSVRGFTRQVLVALVAHIETTECRRIELLNNCSPLENPRASTTDDVECFFSVARDIVGKNFTLKQVQMAWRKICAEFEKRVNPNLPFYYFTSSHDRFYEGVRPSFDENPKKSKANRVPTIESSVLFKSGRASLPVNRSLNVRAQFHNPPASIPPPPTVPVHVGEHSYSKVL